MLGVLFHSVEEMKEINKCQLLTLCSNYWKTYLFICLLFEGCHTGSLGMQYRLGLCEHSKLNSLQVSWRLKVNAIILG